MHIYLFWSESDLEVFALTFDPTGNRLPFEFAPWSKNQAGASLQKVALESLEEHNPVVRAIQRDGFYLARVGGGLSAVTAH